LTVRLNADLEKNITSLSMTAQDLLASVADFSPLTLQASENLHGIGNELAAKFHRIGTAGRLFLRGAFEQSSRGWRRLCEERRFARREKDCENNDQTTNHRAFSKSTIDATI
jgi:hypothetical protein